EMRDCDPHGYHCNQVSRFVMSDSRSPNRSRLLDQTEPKANGPNDAAALRESGAALQFAKVCLADDASGHPRRAPRDRPAHAQTPRPCVHYTTVLQYADLIKLTERLLDRLRLTPRRWSQ
ncbi:hypothetical protein ACJJTC_006460, partial [Scirpophaga incertulas]